MDSSQEVKLSSNWTNISIYVSLILCLIFILVFYFLFRQESEFHIRMIFVGVGMFALTGFAVYQFLYACDARVIGNKLVLKKTLRPSKSYTFDKIGYPSTFRLKRTKYITVAMENEDRSMEKYLIINNNHLLAFEKKDAESALISLRNNARATA